VTRPSKTTGVAPRPEEDTVPEPARTLEIVTPSYAPDFELCRDLVASIRRFGPRDVTHRLLVPRRDLELFTPLAEGAHVVVDCADDVLPRWLRRVPGQNVWVNVRAPWPPVRGWIAQQLVKLAAAAASTADAVMLVDSDIVFVRPFTLEDFLVEGEVPLYRLPGAIDGRLPRHLVWDRVARELLGLPGDDRGQADDYISWPCVWAPAIVRSLLAHVERVGGRAWQSVVGRELHFSEMVLYGRFVDDVVGGDRGVAHVTSMHCVNYSNEETLDDTELRALLDGVGRNDLAVMISAKSGTSIGARRAALRDAFPA
jgi:hypothetical protein